MSFDALECALKLTSRYGDPGFHRHVDAAKILGLLCKFQEERYEVELMIQL